MVAQLRLNKEYKELIKQPIENISAGPTTEENIFEWDATIFGSEGTVYYGGIFKLKIKFSVDYPFKAPHITFLTKIYHPNIHPNGNICLDILKNEWSPSLTVSKLLLSILSLLDDPNPNDPLVPEVANVYKNNRELFNKTARDWTFIYAK